MSSKSKRNPATVINFGVRKVRTQNQWLTKELVELNTEICDLKISQARLRKTLKLTADRVRSMMKDEPEFEIDSDGISESE